MSGIVAVASEVFEQVYTDRRVRKCYRVVQPLLTGDLHSSQYLSAYRALYLFYMALEVDYLKPSSELYYVHHLTIMERLKTRIFQETLQETRILNLLTEFQLKAILKVLNNPGEILRHAEKKMLETRLLRMMAKNVLDFANIHEDRDTIVPVQLGTGSAYLWWSQVVEGTEFNLTVNHSTKAVSVYVELPVEVVTDAVSRSLKEHAPLGEYDSFANVVCCWYRSRGAIEALVTCGYSVVRTEVDDRAIEILMTLDVSVVGTEVNGRAIEILMTLDVSSVGTEDDGRSIEVLMTWDDSAVSTEDNGRAIEILMTWDVSVVGIEVNGRAIEILMTLDVSVVGTEVNGKAIEILMTLDVSSVGTEDDGRAI
ncbi:hypothetical protein EGW08_000832 [Elysia chlorotica]|uniref:Uncharacterized protein n=1 Tax=Elysia chlorotica TaxID=188477 RepID=A0A433UCB6_ELYCH|nr:hypothetical protein EGW08_000832 [Elysia chlorotica]